MLLNTIFDLQVTQILAFSDLVPISYSFRSAAASERRLRCVSVALACHLFLSSAFYAHVSEPAYTLGCGIFLVSIDHRWSLRAVKILMAWVWIVDVKILMAWVCIVDDNFFV